MRLVIIVVLALCTASASDALARQSVFRFRSVYRGPVNTCPGGICPAPAPKPAPKPECKPCQPAPAPVAGRTVIRERVVVRGSAQAIAQAKADIQARHGRVFHPGGSMGGGTFEGVGSSGSASHINTCVPRGRRQLIGCASSYSSVTRTWYHCRIWR
jgi:hypothetical protein